MRATALGDVITVDGKRQPRALSWALGGLLSAVLLAATFRGVDTHRVATLLGGIGWCAPLLLLPSLTAVLLETSAWQYALGLAGHSTRLLALFGVRVGSESVGAVLPLGAVWADALKPALLRSRCGVPLPAGLAAIAIRKYLLVLSQAGYLAVGFVVGYGALRAGFAHALGAPWLCYLALAAAAAMAGVGTGMAVLLGRGHAFQTLLDRATRIRIPAVQRRLSRLSQGALGMDDAAAAFFGVAFRHRARPVLACLFAWLLEATETWLVLEAVGASLRWGDAVGVEALVVLSRHLLPFLPGGLGVQELGYAALFAGAGCDADQVLSLVVLKRVREAVWIAVGAVALQRPSVLRRAVGQGIQNVTLGILDRGRALRRLGSALFIVLAAISCAERPPASPPVARARALPALATRTVVLVAIDGVRWQEVFGGADPAQSDRAGLSAGERVNAANLVPNLFRIMTLEGAAVGAPGAGAPMRASGPNFVSLPGYMEMLTGRTDTGCVSNACGDVPFRTIADDVADMGGRAAVIASWPGIQHAAAVAPEHVVMSIGRHGGSNRDAFEGDPRVAAVLHHGEASGQGPGEDDFRRDVDTGSLACAYLEAARPSFLFVGLGETDEFAHRSDYRGYLNALHDADAIVGRLADDVQRLDAEGHPSTLLVTTDHGRASGFSSHGGDHPESARVWLVATGAGILARGRPSSDSPRTLSDVSQTIRRILGIPSVRAAPAGTALGELFVGRDTTLAAR